MHFVLIFKVDAFSQFISGSIATKEHIFFSIHALLFSSKTHFDSSFEVIKFSQFFFEGDSISEQFIFIIHFSS